MSTKTKPTTNDTQNHKNNDEKRQYMTPLSQNRINQCVNAKHLTSLLPPLLTPCESTTLESQKRIKIRKVRNHTPPLPQKNKISSKNVDTDDQIRVTASFNFIKNQPNSLELSQNLSESHTKTTSNTTTIEDQMRKDLEITFGNKQQNSKAIAKTQRKKIVIQKYKFTISNKKNTKTDGILNNEQQNEPVGFKLGKYDEIFKPVKIRVLQKSSDSKPILPPIRRYA